MYKMLAYYGGDSFPMFKFKFSLFNSSDTGCPESVSSVPPKKILLKMICNDFLVVKVNCWSYVFDIMKYM